MNKFKIRLENSPDVHVTSDECHLVGDYFDFTNMDDDGEVEVVATFNASKVVFVLALEDDDN